MSSADLYEDGFPHGTVDGYNAGCRGSACPGQLDHGMSCRRAQQLSHGDYRYKRLAAAGHTPAQIAAELDGTTPLLPAAPPPAPKATHPKESPTMPKPTPADIPRKNPTTPTAPTSTGPEQLTTAKWTEGLNPRAKTAKLREIREWARANGYPHVPTHGKIPHDALAAYDAATSEISVDLTIDTTKIDAALALAEHSTPLDAIPTDLEPNDIADAELEQPEPEPAGDEQLDIAHRSDLLDETRHRIQETTEQEAVEALGIRLCKQCAKRNHPACTGRIHHGDKSPRCTCTCPAARFLNATADAAAAAQAHADAAETAGANRPQWADITIPEDIQRARRIAVQLEQELAHTTEQLNKAHKALEVTLRAWDREHRTCAEALDIIRMYRALVNSATDELTETDTLVAAQRNQISTLLAANIRLHDQAARPWWARRR